MLQGLLRGVTITGAGATTDPFFSSVVLLMGFEGADGSVTAPGMTDESPSARGTATVNGNAQIDTANFKYGASSLLLDGNGDYITFPDSTDWEFPGQFTVECFFYLSSSAVNNTSYIITAHRGNSVQVGWQLSLTWSTSNPSITFAFSTTGIGATDTVSLAAAGLYTTDTWYHFAADRDGSDVMRIYLAGVKKASGSHPGATANVAVGLGVGATAIGTTELIGSLEEVRITKGVARYATDTSFTPPTAAFPRS